MKKLIALVLTLASLLSLTACGGSSSDSGSAANSGSSDAAVSITIFNSKNEIQPDLEAAAEAYSKANNVNIEVYYSQDTVAAHLATRYAAKDPYTINMVDAKFNSLMDTFDVLKEYNMFKESGAISVEDDQVHQALSEGVDAFQFGGCWEWNDIIDYDYTGNIGLMPIPQNMNDEFTGKIVVFGSKYFYVDNSENTTQEQRDAAVAFLNWFALSDEGKKLVSETCAMISPFKSNDVPCANDIGVSVKKYADAGLTIASYDYAPDDHYSKLGAEMQRYLADQCTRQELADAIEAYWASTTPVQH